MSKSGDPIPVNDRLSDLYRQIVEAAPTAMIGVDLEGQIIIVNAEAEEVFGYERSFLLGKPIEALVPLDLRSEHLDQRVEYLRDPRPCTIAGRNVHGRKKDGSKVPVEVRLTPIETSGGRLVLASITNLDEYRRGEERLARVVEAAPNAMIMVARDGRIVLANAQVETLFGYDRDELMGQPIEKVVPSRFRSDHPKYRDQFYSDPKVRAMGAGRDLFGLRKDGSEVPIEIGLNPLEMPEGMFTLASIIDITERKKAEEQTRSASQYARSLLEASLDPLVTISPAGKITDVNEATITATGVPREALIGTDFSEYFTEPEEARVGYLKVFAKGFVTDYPLTIRHRGGRLTDVLYNASVYRDAQGTVLGVFAAARDVTARKRAEAEVTERRAKEMERLAELERFQRLTVGRELKMIELKKEIEEMKKQLPPEREGL